MAIAGLGYRYLPRGTLEMNLVPSHRLFSSGLDTLKDLLWHPGTHSGIILLAPIGFEEGNTLIFLSLATKTADAIDQAETVFHRLVINP